MRETIEVETCGNHPSQACDSMMVCSRYGCWRMPLKFMAAGESHETRRGHFTIMVDGYYCPSCGGGYGGGQ